MKRFLIFVSYLLVVVIVFSGCRKRQQQEGLSYPETAKVDSVDVYFGHEVSDPYRWLEVEQSELTMEWVEEQNKVTHQYLDQISFRDDIKQRLTDVWSYTRQNSPEKKGDNVFYFRHDGIRNHAVLYVRGKLDESERVLIDPNLFSEDGTISLAATSVSPDGKYVAYAISEGGSDWREVFVREVESGKDLDDHLKWVKFSGLSWDDDGFFYSRYDKPEPGTELSASNEFQKVFYHKLGTSQDDDVLVHEEPEYPRRNFSAQVEDEQDYLLLYSRQSTQGNRLYIGDLNGSGEWKLADNDFETQSNYIATINGRIIVRTNYDAPRYRLMSIDPLNPLVDNWEEILPEQGDVLRNVTVTNDFIVAHYMVDVLSELKVYDISGHFMFNIDLPFEGTVTGEQAFKGENLLYLNFTSFTVPQRVLKIDLHSKNVQTYFEPQVDFDPDVYDTELVFVNADDGAQIPVFITKKKGLELDGQNPTLLYGYGGFNVVQPPRFDARILPWLENGGIYASAHIRGGGEYGDQWYRGGIKKNKQRVFDDFILSAEYLIDNGYTSNERLAIMGGSNGGLLVGAVSNQRPDLFQVALPAVGVMDMLRYQYFTIGWAWAGDYGRSDDSEEMFQYLYNYSPLHNIPKGDVFPATFVTTADHDDRVVPAHSYKYIATLQENYQGSNPVLIRIETKAGHGAGKPLSMQIDEVADKWAFAFYNMGVEFINKDD